MGKSNSQHYNDAVANAMNVTILQALERLLETRSVDEVTVSDICQETGISRPTFYRHFRDKHDVLQWMWDESSHKACERAEGATSYIEEFEAQIYGIIDAYERRHDPFERFFGSQDYNSYLNHGIRQRIEYITDLTARALGSEPSDELRREISFFVDGESRLVRDWLCDGKPLSTERVVAIIMDCLPRQLRTALETERRPSG